MIRLPKHLTAAMAGLITAAILVAFAPAMAPTSVRAQDPVTIRFWNTYVDNFSAFVEEF